MFSLTTQRALYVAQIPVSTMVHALQLIALKGSLVIVKGLDITDQHATEAL